MPLLDMARVYGHRVATARNLGLFMLKGSG